jgi:hypothetical protein
MATFLEVAAATGARRGEVLALRWSDTQDSEAAGEPGSLKLDGAIVLDGFAPAACRFP